MCAQTIELERQKLNSRFNMEQYHGQPAFNEKLFPCGKELFQLE